MSVSAVVAGPANLAAFSKKTKDESTKIQDAAAQFEALLIGQMLKSARSPDGEAAIAGESDGPGSTLLDMSEQQFAQTLASSGGLGLGKMIIAGLKSNAHR